MWALLEHAYVEPIYISSNRAREDAIPLALAASLGWLSNIHPHGKSYGRTWHVTSAGYTMLAQRNTFNEVNEDPTQCSP